MYYKPNTYLEIINKYKKDKYKKDKYKKDDEDKDISQVTICTYNEKKVLHKSLSSISNDFELNLNNAY